MEIVTEIFEVIGGVVTQFANTLGSAITSITSMFYDPTNGMTFLGVLLLIAAGVGLVYWGFRLIRGLIKRA